MARSGLAGNQRHGMLLLVLILATTIPSGHMAALIGSDHVTANYPGFRRDPGDATALAAVGTTRGSMTDGIVIRKVASLSSPTAFTLQKARELALSHPHMISEQYEDKLSRTVLAEQKTTACDKPAYGFVARRKMRLHGYGGFIQEWTQADVYVLELVGQDVWEAAYERTDGPDVAGSTKRLVGFVGNFCVQPHYRT